MGMLGLTVCRHELAIDFLYLLLVASCPEEALALQT